MDFSASPQGATVAMTLLAWNCCGSGGNLGSPKMLHLARLIAATKAQVIFISETRNSNVTSHALINRFNVDQAYIVPALGQSWASGFSPHMM